MANRRQRVMAIVIAGLFLATSVATGVAVLWQINEDNKMSNSVAESTEDTSDNQPTNQPKEGALQGTKLADFEPLEEVKELQIIDTVEGDGEEVQPNATVTAHYTGAIAKTGIIFQSSHDMGQPIEFPLNGVIAGWTEGVPGMKVGGKRRLIIPAAKAYGEQSPSPDIPANSDLVFDIELTAVTNP